MSKTTVTYEEQQLMCLYDTGTRTGLVDALNNMRAFLSKDEQDLKELTDSAIKKLGAMTDEEYSVLDLIPDFVR